MTGPEPEHLMDQRLRHLLHPVRRREFHRVIAHGVCVGAVAAAVVSGLLLLVQWRYPFPGSVGIAIVALVVGPLVGGLIGARRAPDWRRVAATIDDRCQLQDRAQTALEFAGGVTGPFQALQIQDAVRRLEAVDPARVVERRLPRAWPVAPVAYVGTFAVLVAVLLAVPPTATVAADTPPEIVAEADRLDGQAKGLEEAARELDSDELRQLAALMRKTADDLRKPGTDVPEAMAKISELQAALNELKKANDPTEVDQQLKELGGAVGGAKPLQEAGKALQDLQLNKAAEALERAKGAKFDPREAKATEDRLKESAKQMAARGQQKLGKATEKLASGVAGDKKEMDQGVQDINQELKAQERRRRISQLMAQEQQRLNDCKNRCEQLNRHLIEQKNENRNPSESQNQSQSQANQRQESPGAEKSKDESKDEAATRRPVGQNKTELQNQEGGGRPGTEAGDPETDEPTTGTARRVPRELYQKFQKQSEAALDAEQIPLGHRQMIRRYFELIRPSGAGDATPASPAPKGR
jgi:hypothetical protein